MPAPVSSLRNLGERMEWYLSEVGVNSAEDLKREGYMPVYWSLRQRFPSIMNRMALYALYGALYDQDCMKLSQKIKDTLQKELDAYSKKAQRKKRESA